MSLAEDPANEVVEIGVPRFLRPVVASLQVSGKMTSSRRKAPLGSVRPQAAAQLARCSDQNLHKDREADTRKETFDSSLKLHHLCCIVKFELLLGEI